MISLLLTLVLTQANPADWVQPYAPSTTPAPSATPPPAQDTRAAYEAAVRLIGEKQYGQAVTQLNELAQKSPSAELYAARCSALHGLRNFAAALADCQYALRLKPAAALPNALYGQALAEEYLGANAAAAQHYRDYANLTHVTITPELRSEALRRAAMLQAPAPMPAPMPVAAAPAPRVTVQVGATVGPPSRSGFVSGGQRVCNSSLDCGSGGWCKDRGDGVQVCMNKGGHGDSCQSSLDCGSGGWCKDRGDGFMVCMNKGGRGAACNSSLDCGSGMFCRGDDLKYCE